MLGGGDWLDALAGILCTVAAKRGKLHEARP